MGQASQTNQKSRMLQGKSGGARRPGLATRPTVAQWHRLGDVADDAATYWQVGQTTFQQTCIPGGVQWTPWPPGEYVQAITKERVHVMAETPAGTSPADGILLYGCSLRVYRSASGGDSHQVRTQREWGELTMAQVLAVEHAEYTLEGALLAKADDVALAHKFPVEHIPLVPTPPAGHEAA